MKFKAILYRKKRRCPFCNNAELDVEKLAQCSLLNPYHCQNCGRGLYYLPFLSFIHEVETYFFGIAAIVFLIGGAWEIAIVMFFAGYLLMLITANLWPIRVKKQKVPVEEQ